MAEDANASAHPTSEPATSEEVTAQIGETSPAPMNRAERRAQARGKKGGGAAFNAAVPHNQNTRGPGNRGPGGSSQIRLPNRSGGK